MNTPRQDRQLELIAELVSIAAESGVELWLRGGWALDFFLGRLTREHGDIDLFVWAGEAPKLLELLRRRGYEEAGGPPPEMQRNLIKDGEELHMTLLERNELGVVTAGSRWADQPWPDGMLEGMFCELSGIRCRVISPEAQLWAKVEMPKALGHSPREHDAADIELLRRALGR